MVATILGQHCPVTDFADVPDLGVMPRNAPRLRTRMDKVGAVTCFLRLKRPH